MVVKNNQVKVFLKRISASIGIPFLIMLVAALIFAPILLLTGRDYISDEYAASLSLIQHLGGATQSTVNCWRKKKIFGQNCKELIAILAKNAPKNQYYLITDHGELVGIDFKSQVVVVLSPEIAGDTFKWHCYGNPQSAMPRSCIR